MIELSVENAADFLRQNKWIGAGPVTIEPLSGGVSNQVLRVTTPERRFVLKQSRPQLRTRDAWFSDLARIWREQEVMQTLHPHLPDVVPEVLYVDRANFVYAMSHAPLDALVWKSQLLAGHIDIELGRRVGAVLGRMHQISAERVAEFAAFRDIKVYEQLRIDPFYVRVQERCPDVADAIGPIIEEMRSRKDALCHGDYTPKNMLIHAGGFTLVDYETAHVGDPTMDLGLFVAHLTLKAVRSPERSGEFAALLRAFWQGYCDRISFCSHRELEERGVRHWGVCLLARVDGTSPVDYLPNQERRDVVRHMARSVLLRGVNSWEQLWKLLANEN
jgi:5-methylthioribose kinase